MRGLLTGVLVQAGWSSYVKDGVLIISTASEIQGEREIKPIVILDKSPESLAVWMRLDTPTTFSFKVKNGTLFISDRAAIEAEIRNAAANARNLGLGAPVNQRRGTSARSGASH